MVSHTGSSLVLHSFISYLVQGIDRCRDTCAAVRGGFQPKIPNQLLGLQISVSFRNSGTSLIISYILRYSVIISSIWAHPKQLSAVPKSQGRKQLPHWTKTLSCLEVSELLHAPAIPSGTERLSALQIGRSIGHLLPWGRHLFLIGRLAAGEFTGGRRD